MSQPGRRGASTVDVKHGITDRYGAGSMPARVAIARLLALAFVVRGLISITDALSVANDGLRPLPIIGPVAFSAISPLWSLLWALLAIVAGVGLAFRWRIGWLVGAAVAVAYLVSGIADLSLLDWSSGATLQGQRLFVVVVDLVVPAAALFLLSAARVAAPRPLVMPRGRRDAARAAGREAAGLARRAGTALATPRRRALQDGEGRMESALDRWRHPT